MDEHVSLIFDAFEAFTAEGEPKSLEGKLKGLQFLDIVQVKADEDPLVVFQERLKRFFGKEDINITSDTGTAHTREPGEALPGGEGPDRPPEEEKPVLLNDPEFGRVMTYFMDNIAPFPSSLAVSGLKNYTKVLGADVVIHAMQVCQDAGHPTWNYLRKILLRYDREKIRTMDDVRRDEACWDGSGNGKRRRVVQDASPDDGGLVDLSADYGPVEGLVALGGRELRA